MEATLFSQLRSAGAAAALAAAAFASAPTQAADPDGSTATPHCRKGVPYGDTVIVSFMLPPL